MTFYSTVTSLSAAALAVIAITVAPPLGTASIRAPSQMVARPNMSAPRSAHTATALADGCVLVVGGYGAGSAVQAHAELFDPSTNTFAPTGMLGAARAGHVAVTLPKGTVLIAGGVGPNWQFLSSAEVYDPATGRFAPTASMSVAREGHVGVALNDGGVLITGGYGNGTGPRASAWVYRP